MLSKEIKQLIELSGGKLIVSEGEIKESYVIMKLDKHLAELTAGVSRKVPKKSSEILKKEVFKAKKSVKSGLTREGLLDKINTDIAEVKRKNIEQEVAQSFELGSNKDQEDRGEFYYEKVH